MRTTLSILVGAIVLAGPADGQRPSGPADPAVGRIQPNWIEPHVRFLSSALLRGRDTGTPGAELAARYVAAEFGRLGLKAFGGDGGYLLPVPLRQSTVVEAATSASLTTRQGTVALVLGRDYLVHPAKNADRAEESAPIVFVGFGVTAPEAGYDDYQGVDVRGKIVAMVFGGPPAVPPDERGHYAGLAAKEQNARARGAVGVITLMPVPGALLDEKLGQLEGFGWVGPDQVAHSPFFESGAVLRFTESGTKALLAAAGRTVEDVLQALGKGPVSFPVEATLSWRSAFRHQAVTGYNVAGVLEGSDPSLGREYVVFSAHLDHVGVHPPVDGDSVNYGAIDNAGGTASMMAVARAMVAMPRPKRSVLFLAVTGEEKGILGSDYFVHAPAVPIGSMVANVNLDNFVMLAPTKDLFGYGAKYSTLDAEVTGMLDRLDLAPSEDPLPWMTIFTRSDHYAFMRRGIPGVMLFGGPKSGKDGKDGVAVMREYFDRVHHTPRDRLEQAIDWGAGVRYAEANLSIGYSIANRAERPRWKGRFFFHQTGVPISGRLERLDGGRLAAR
ncbi:MAG: M28 family peptidase [Gemmatimonadales bacterium]